MSGAVKRFSVEKEYEKNPDITSEDIRKLREWLTSQPHLPGDYLDELDLLIVYHCCEMSPEVSKQVLDLHYTLRSLLVYFRERRLDHRLDHTLNTVLSTVMTFKTLKNGQKIIMSGVVTRPPVEKEYQKNPNISSEDIRKLREWLTRQPHLPRDYLEDLDLLIVYHCCEMSPEVSKQVLDLHYTLRSLLVYFRERRLDHRLVNTLNTVLFATLPTPTAKGYRVMYLRFLDPDPPKFFLNEIAKVFMMVFDLWQHEEGTWPGLVVVINLEGATLGHLARVEIISVKEILFFVQECMLVRLKAVHFINAPNFMEKLMLLMKPFMKKQLQDMIHIHQCNSNTLYEHVSREALPKEEGGSYKDHSTIKDETIKRLYSNEEFFEKESLRRVDESLRPGGKSILGDEFGIQGSFKKLIID